MVESAVTPQLPLDIVEEIICKLPMKDLNRFRCVSTSWNSLVSEYHLARKHLNHFTKFENTYILFNTTYECLRACPLSSIPGRAQAELKDVVIKSTDCKEEEYLYIEYYVFIRNSCNGLLLLEVDQTFFVYNPRSGTCTRIHDLPPEAYNYDCFDVGFGYDSINDDYKIIKFAPRICVVYGFVLDAWVYSMKYMSWTKAESFLDDTDPRGRCIFMNGVFHWLARPISSKLDFIVSFDMALLEFKITNIPISIQRWESRLINLRGMLCLYYTGGTSLKIWETPLYASHKSWVKVFDIPGHKICRSGRSDKLEIRFCKPMYMYESGEILIMAVFGESIKFVVRSASTVLYEDTMISPHLFVEEAFEDIVSRASIMECAIVHEGSLCLMDVES